MNKTVTAVGIAAALCALAQPALAADAKPAYPPFGFDLTARRSGHAAGQRLLPVRQRPLPGAQHDPGRRAVVYAPLRHDARDRRPAARDPRGAGQGRRRSSPPTCHGKVGAFYAAFMDEARIEQLGTRAIAPELDAIRAAPDLAALATLMGRSTVDVFPSPFSVLVDVDLKKPDDLLGLHRPGRPRLARHRLLHQAGLRGAAQRLPRVHREDARRSPAGPRPNGAPATSWRSRRASPR